MTNKEAAFETSKARVRALNAQIQAITALLTKPIRSHGPEGTNASILAADRSLIAAKHELEMARTKIADWQRENPPS